MSLSMQLQLNRDNFRLAVECTVPTDRFTAIYGHSGAGKTTLLRWIAGLEPESQGSLKFNGQYWQRDQVFTAPQKREIAYVFQDARLFPHLDVYGNLNYAFQRRFNNNGPSIDKVCHWFGLNALLEANVSILSGGEQQRVALARALLSSPQLILMDEPLGSLDQRSKSVILGHLQQLHRHIPAPVIYVSHDIAEVSRLADHLLVMENGQLKAEGPMIELSSRVDLAINHEEQAASIIEARIQQHDDQYQLTRLQLDDHLSLHITRIKEAVGGKVRVRIPARDVSITLEESANSSILNILPATIDAIENVTAARVLVRLRVAGQLLLVRLTHKSLDRLQLTEGKSVFAQIKSVALISDTSQP